MTVLLILSVLVFVTALVVLVLVYDNYKQLEIQQEQIDDLFKGLNELSNNVARAFETNLEINKHVSSCLDSIASSLKELAKKQIKSYKKKEEK